MLARSFHIIGILIWTVALLAPLSEVKAQESPDSESLSTLAPPNPVPYSVPAYRMAGHVAVITIEGPIDGVTLLSLERRVLKAQNAGATAIVFDIDTPGGELIATLDICNLIKDHSATPANTIAWINPTAYSAGSIIALACREIVFAPNATFGDAAPIRAMPGMGLVQMNPAERAKMEAPILTEVVDSARRNHYDENLVQAFISVGIELWLVEHQQTNQRIFVTRAEYETLFDESPPDQMASVAPPNQGEATPAVQPWTNQFFDPAESESQTLTAEEKAAQIEQSQLLPPVRALLTESDRGQWNLITQVVTSDRLLTIRPAEALHYGLAQDVISNDEELKRFLGASTLTRYDRSWSEGLVRFLINPYVKLLLIVIFLIALFIELAAPGLGVFGATAVMALLLLIGAPFLAGMAQWWDILLILLGIALVAAELFLIPGIGIAGVAGAVCLIAGMVGTFITGDLGSPQGQEQLVRGLLITLLSFFTAGVSIWFISRQLHSIPILNRVILSSELGQSEPAYGHGSGGSMLEAMAGEPDQALTPGDVGITETDLRPAGRARFNDRLIDVKSTGEFIEKGSRVRVVSVGRFSIEVEEQIS